MPISTLIGWLKMLTKITVLLTFLIIITKEVPAVEDQNADYYFMLGEKYLLNEDADKARVNFEKVAKLGEDSSLIHTKLSEAYQLNGDYDSAITEVKRAIELDPTNIVAKLMETEYLITEKSYQKALEDCNDILEIDPYNRDAVSYKATMLIKLKRFSEANQVLDGYRSTQPSDEFPYYYVGIIYQLDNNLTKAEKYYKKALEITPSFEPATNALMAIKRGEIKSSLTKRNYREALQKIDELLKDDPSGYSTLIQKAMIQDEAGKIKETVKTLEEALTYYPDNERILYYLGITYDKIGQKQKASQKMREAIEANPDNAEALNYLGYYYATEKPQDLIEAEILVKKALVIMPTSYYILDSMGWVYYKKWINNKKEEDLLLAKNFLKDALTTSLKEQKFEPEIFEHLNTLYKSLKDDVSRDALKTTLSDMLKSNDYSDKKAEIEETLRKI